MISAGDFRNGVTFEEDGNVLQVVEFQHVKPGKGAAFVRTKTKNVITGAVIEKSYNPTAKFPTAYIERKDMEYSYEDGGTEPCWRKTACHAKHESRGYGYEANFTTQNASRILFRY